MKKKLLLGLSIATLAASCFGFAACGEEELGLEGLNDFNGMVGYTVTLPEPEIPAEIGEGLAYTAKIVKPNGVELKGHKTDGKYSFTVEQEGKYEITYSVTNAEGETYTKTIYLTAKTDKEKPVLGTVKSTLDGVTIGDEITIPDISVQDNSLKAPYNASVDIGATLIDVSGKRTSVAIGDKITLDNYGKYTLEYVATDRAFNVSAAKTYTFDVAGRENVSYAVQYYTETLDGDYVMEEEDTSLSGMICSRVDAKVKSFEGFYFDVSNENNLLNSTVAEDGSTALKVYYKRKTFTIRFDSTGGSAVKQQIIKYGGLAVRPEDPENGNKRLLDWYFNGESFDFDAPVYSDVSLNAVWSAKTRYDVMLSDGTNVADWKMDYLDIGGQVYQEDEVYVEGVKFEGEDVLAYTILNTGLYPNYAPLAYIDREGAYEPIISEISTKKYFGLRVYSSVGHCEFNVVFMIDGPTGLKRAEYVYRLKEGWNEVIVNLPALSKAKGAKLDEQNRIYRIALGVRGNVFSGTDAIQMGQDKLDEATFYLDDIYGTNYDMENIIDFESKGDLNRYEYGIKKDYSDRDYAYNRYDFPGGVTSTVGVVDTDDGERALKVTKNEGREYANLRLLNASGAEGKSGRFFANDLSEYTAIVITVRVETSDSALYFNGERITNNGVDDSGQWVTYTYDLSKVENKSNVPHLTFQMWGGEYFYINSIEFVK